MKARDSVSRYESRLREYTNFSRRTIADICRNIGGRPAGSEEELKAQQYMAEKVGDAADEVHTEEFTVSPYALFSEMQAGGFLCIAAMLLFHLSRIFSIPALMWAALCCVVFEAVLIIVEFLFYRQMTDWLLPKKTSHNVYMIRRPEGEVKRRIIMGGHADSSWEWRYTHMGGKNLMIPSLAIPIVG
nr:hypothetical protein [Clostridia bacterium]